MNITIVTPIFPPRTGGPSTYVWELIHRLNKQHQITIVCFSNHPDWPVNCQLIPVSTKGNSLTRQWRLFTTLLKVSRSTDIFYIQGPLVVGLAGSLAALLTATPRFIKYVGDEVWETARVLGQTSQTLERFYQHLQLQYLPFVAIQTLVFNLSSKIIVPSEYLKSFLTSNYHLKGDKITVIHNSIQASSRDANKDKHQLITVGRLVPWKNIDQIIKAVHLARRSKPWRLLIVGEGPEESALNNLVSKLKLKKDVSFTGRVSHQQTLDLISRSHSLILYSDYEGLSHTLIESMFLKTPIIASDILANREVTAGHANFVSLNNPKLLAQAINQPPSNTSQAYQFARQHYSWSNHINKILEVFHEYSHTQS